MLIKNIKIKNKNIKNKKKKTGKYKGRSEKELHLGRLQLNACS
jgi:hypothetical protein